MRLEVFRILLYRLLWNEGMIVIKFCIFSEKKLLASSQDYGKDLPDVQNLRKKAQRLSAELKSHEPHIQAILENVDKYKQQNPVHEDEIQAKCDSLSHQWNELNDLSADRYLQTFSIICFF